MKKHRVAVVGCGNLARDAHLKNCRANPRIELVATCDIDRASAESARDEFGAGRAETDWRRIVEASDIDTCILCTHTNLRGAFIIPALEAGKAVYTEKPLAPNRQEMIDIVLASRRTGRPVCVGHNRRSGPAMQEFKRLVEKARKSPRGYPAAVDRMEGREYIPEEEYLQVLMRINDDSRSWKSWVFFDEEGLMHAEMVHFIDLALWLNAPLYPVRVHSEGSPRGNFTILIRFNDGSQTTMVHTMVGHFNYPKELFEVTTRNVTVAMDQHFEVRQVGMDDEPAQRFFPYAAGGEWAREPGMAGYIRESAAERVRALKAGEVPRFLNVNKGHYAQLDRFIDHVEGKGENPCPVEGAVAVNRVALKVLESARSGIPVPILPEDWHLPRMGA
jgi:predicted dehydrogenase